MADVPPPREEVVVSSGFDELLYSLYCLPCMCYDERRPAVTVFNGMAQCEGHMRVFVNTRNKQARPGTYDFIFKLDDKPGVVE